MSEVPYAPVEPVAPMPGDKKGLAIASLVIGIVNLCLSVIPFCGGIFAVVGLILGILGLKSSKKTLAIIGIVLAVLTLLSNAGFTIFGLTSGPQMLQDWGVY